MPTSLAAVELLAALAPVLDGAGHRWYLFGAQAVLLYGEPRLTADVDVTVELPDAQVGPLVAALAAAGFRLRVAQAEAFVARTWVLPFEHVATGLPLDMVLAGSGLEATFLDHVRTIDLGGVSVPTIAPEDLVVAKLLAGRPKDLDDVRGVLRQQGAALDLVRARALLRELEQALDRSDLLSALDTLARPGRG